MEGRSSGSEERMDIVDLYAALRDEPRLQKNWERNQPRFDRALEAILIVQTPREIATASLLAVKLRFEPTAAGLRAPRPDVELAAWARTQGRGGARLAEMLEGGTPANEQAMAAAACSLRFYRDRGGANELVRLPWTSEGLARLAAAPPDNVINPALKPTSKYAAAGLPRLAALLGRPLPLTDDGLRAQLRAIPGLGPERADAVGCFAYRQPWPIVDEYLWKMLIRHESICTDLAGASGYDRRRVLFEPYWQRLTHAGLGDPNEIAAALYLWADEAERYGFRY